MGAAAAEQARARRPVSAACLLLLSVFLHAQEARSPVPVVMERLPEITSLRARVPAGDGKRTEQNLVLAAYNQDVQDAYRAVAQGKPVPVQFYQYTAQKGDTILTLAARFSVPQETLATANAWESADIDIAGRNLVVPAAPGLFVARAPSSTLEILVAQENAALLAGGAHTAYDIGGREFAFVPGAHISATARAFFLDTAMRMPLTDYVLTSDFGYRISPITGTWKNHAGVDLAAPLGTPVRACKRGTVAHVYLNDRTFGNYIIIRHANDMTSVYAHLSAVGVREGQEVSAGAQIGTVGTTGASTGPHLHFEVRQNGRATNPLRQ